MRLWSVDCYEYLTGRDIDGRPIYWTHDEFDEANPIKPFPTNKPYLRHMIKAAFSNNVFFMNKPRQMIVTTTLCGAMDWYCTTIPARVGLISKHKEDEAKTILRKKIRTPHSHMPQWLKDKWWISDAPATIIHYHNKSEIHGVAQNFAVADARGSTASIVLTDEAAFQELFPDIFDATAPMALYRWSVSTPTSTGRGAGFMKQAMEIGAVA